MITILYPYRNRELKRIKRSLDSLAVQKGDFEVVFIDYGSKKETATAVELLVSSYSFASYVYHPTANQPWNKCKALNSAIKQCTSSHCFVADVDMIFHSDFIEILVEESKKQAITYFQVGFLNQDETEKELPFEDYKVNHLSDEQATGMTLFPIAALYEIKGFDEFFHFWGAEDTDVHNRLRKKGYVMAFYTHKLLMLHQWHPSYRKNETKELTRDLQLSNIVRMNYDHMLVADKGTILADAQWGELITQEDYEALEASAIQEVIVNKKEKVDQFLFSTLYRFKGGILSVRFVTDPFQKTFKYKVKKVLGKKVPDYYTLKEINDRLLLHIISFYHHFPYSYQVSDDLKSIVFKIKK